VTSGNGTWWSGKSPLDIQCRKVQWQADRTSAFLGLPVTPIMCFAGTRLPEPQRDFDGVIVCSTTILLDIIERHAAALSAEDIGVAEQRARSLVRQHRSSTQVNSPAADLRPPRPASSRRSSTAPRGPQASLVGALARLGAIAVVLLIAIPAWPAVSRFVSARAFGGLKTPPAATSPPSRDVALSPEVQSSTVDDTASSVAAPDPPTSALEDFLPPSVEFTCSEAGQGWIAAAVPSEYRLDEVGFDLWYSINGSETWTYWGKFKSGISAPNDLGGIDAQSTVLLKAGRNSFLEPPAMDPAIYAAPTDPC
jgi:hypothetical protein